MFRKGWKEEALRRDGTDWPSTYSQWKLPTAEKYVAIRTGGDQSAGNGTENCSISILFGCCFVVCLTPKDKFLQKKDNIDVEPSSQAAG